MTSNIYNLLTPELLNNSRNHDRAHAYEQGILHALTGTYDSRLFGHDFTLFTEYNEGKSLQSILDLAN